MKFMLEYFSPVSDKHYDCADTEIEIHVLRFLNVAHEFGAGKYAETIYITILGVEDPYSYNWVKSHSMWYELRSQRNSFKR